MTSSRASSLRRLESDSLSFFFSTTIMKKRLAKKALKGPYYQIWKNRSGKEIWVPRNGRCWGIIQRACYFWGHPEWIEEMTKEIITESN